MCDVAISLRCSFVFVLVSLNACCTGCGQTFDAKIGWYLNDDESATCGRPDENLVFVLEALRSRHGRWRLPLNAPVSCFKRREELERPIVEAQMTRVVTQPHASQQFQRQNTQRMSTLL